jgi:polysaccharide deacetylase family protein (PEP-CTERM system associated)
VKPTALFTIDVEDWHQLVHRRLGRDDWDQARPEFPRQMATLLALLDELGAKATFFLLGMTAERYPDVVARLASHGEIASHGYAHIRVYTQSEAEFRDDVRRSVEVIGAAAGRRPAGYRAPEFSINRDTPWAYEILADFGFDYDSSQHDNRRIPNRIGPVPRAPYRLELPSGRTLWEMPTPSVGRVPVGGGAYWRLFPAPVIVRALSTMPWPVLYFHPYEFDPLPLRAELPDGVGPKQRVFATSRRALRNPGRALVAARLRKVAQHFRLTSFEEAHEQIEREHGASTRALSPQGVLV